MREIKLKYVFSDGVKFISEIYNIDLIEYIARDDISYHKEKGFDLAAKLQFTGLKDCNGVDIYEGDILRVIYDCSDDPCQTVVNYDGGALFIDVEGCDYDYTAIGWALENCGIEEIEVIGNIHENKDLLK